jgi:transcriptional regulator with XRE-family HTH domain
MVTSFSWRQPRSWSLLLLCLLLLGCSTRVVYYWLDVGIVWQLDDYFSLDRSQKRLLGNEVKGLMAWHRQYEVPRYADDLDALAKAVVSPMSPAQVSLHLEAAQQSLTRTLENTVPRAVRLARTLTEEQVAMFMKDRLSRQTEREQDFARQPKAERLREFTDRMNKRLVFWIGEVKPAQAPLVAQWVAWQYELQAPWLEFQSAWTKELDRLMQQRQSPDFGAQLTALLQQGDGLMDGRFTGYTDQSRQRTVNWLSALSQSLDISQRAHLYTLLKGYARDFRQMSQG